ncbi:MAG TPA: protein translocase subunit SecF [Abditibacterium sp.]|jgi:preprotein translocase subunit SecF
MNFRGKNIDLVGKMNLWFGISLAIILVGLVSWLAFGLNLGIDFKGGSQFTYRIPEKSRPQSGQEAALLGKVRSGLEDAKLIGTRSQIAGGQDLVVNTSALTDSEANAQESIVSKVVGSAVNAPNIKPEGRQQVGAVIGDELRANAIKGVVLGVLAIAGWIYIRYNFAGDGLRYAVAGIVALVHDVFVLLGLFALIGRIDPRIEIDSGFIAALLTVVGYSINDSVVIFDRLRENLRLRRAEPFEKIVNESLLETMSRSINTGLTVLIMLFVLLMFGGESIYNFTLAMLIGIASGLYSSIFNASMVLVAWHRWDEKKAAQARANRPAVTVRETPRTGAVKPRAK